MLIAISFDLVEQTDQDSPNDQSIELSIELTECDNESEFDDDVKEKLINLPLFHRTLVIESMLAENCFYKKLSFIPQVFIKIPSPPPELT